MGFDIFARGCYSAAGTLLIAAGACSAAVSAWMIYNLFLHPLRNQPGPSLWACTRLPWCWNQYHGRLHRKIEQLHAKHGPVVRVAPDELSYTTETAWKSIYGQRNIEMRKDPIFSVSNPSGVPNVINSDRVGHSRQRRLLSHAFSEKALREQEDILLAYVNKFMRRLSDVYNEGPVNLVAWLNFTTYDVVGDLAFGEDFGCLDRGEYDDFTRSVTRGTKELMMSQMLRYYNLFGLYRFLMPKSIAGTRLRILGHATNTVERRILRTTDRKDFLHYILSADEEKGMTRPEIHSNAFTLVIAGSESSAGALSGIFFLLMKHPKVYDQLVSEIRSAYRSDDEIRLANVQNLEYLEAVTLESLRLYPPVPVSLPRRVPIGGEMIDGNYVPAETTVGVHHYSTYRSAHNFYRPNDFLPERWLANHRDSEPFVNDKRASHQPFAFGPRNCLGKNLARAELRLVLTKLLWHFDARLSEGQDDWINTQLAYGLWWKTPLMCKLTPVARN